MRLVRVVHAAAAPSLCLRCTGSGSANPAPSRAGGRGSDVDGVSLLHTLFHLQLLLWPKTTRKAHERGQGVINPH